MSLQVRQSQAKTAQVRCCQVARVPVSVRQLVCAGAPATRGRSAFAPTPPLPRPFRPAPPALPHLFRSPLFVLHCFFQSALCALPHLFCSAPPVLPHFFCPAPPALPHPFCSAPLALHRPFHPANPALLYSLRSAHPALPRLFHSAPPATSQPSFTSLSTHVSYPLLNSPATLPWVPTPPHTKYLFSAG